MDILQCSYLFLCGWTGYICILAIANITPMNILSTGLWADIHFVFSLFSLMLSCMLNFLLLLRNCPVALQCDYTILHFLQQRLKVLVVLYPYQHLERLVFIFTVVMTSHCYYSLVMLLFPHCGFHLGFLDD